MLIGFAGKMGSGKTTAANMVSGAAVTSMAAPLKRCVGDLFMLDEKQLYTLEGKNKVDKRWGKSPREIMQLFGTEFIRANFPGFWVTRMAIYLKRTTWKGVMCIDDCRFEDEAKMVRDLGGIVIHIIGRQAEDAGIAGHASEYGLEVCIGDHVIDNSCSLEELKRKIGRLMEYEKVTVLENNGLVIP